MYNGRISGKKSKSPVITWVSFVSSFDLVVSHGQDFFCDMYTIDLARQITDIDLYVKNTS